MKKLVLILGCCFMILNLSCAQPVIQWQKCLGGSVADYAFSVQQTADGGFIVAGFTDSNDGDVTGNHGGGGDYWIVKLNSAGNIHWEKCLGGSSGDMANSVQQTADGGYIVAGVTNSNNGDVTGFHGDTDYWVVKLDSSGTIQWQKCLGGTDSDWANSIQQTSDGGFVVAGYTYSNNGDVTGNHDTTGFSTGDFWIVKLDSSGNVQWQRCHGGSNDDWAYSVQQATDGGYIVAGLAESLDGDVTGHHGGIFHIDYWVAKLDIGGNIQWQKCLGGTGDDRANSVQQTADGGFVVAGYTNSNDGDVSGNHSIDTSDHWVVKLDAGGNIQWQKCLGGTKDDKARSVQQTDDGGFIIAGGAISNDGDVSYNHGDYDYWIVKLDGSGNFLWQKCLGGTGFEYVCESIQQTSDGGFIVAGYSGSNDGDVSGNHGSLDYWIVKLSPYVLSIEEENNNGAFDISPNPVTSSVNISFSLTMAKNVSIAIIDLNGRLITTIANRFFETGENSLEWNVDGVEAGIYFLKIETKDNIQTEKISVLK